MRTLPSGVRATAQPGEHVARPVYSLKGVNLMTAAESTCRSCSGLIAKTDQDDGLRGSWRHIGTPPTPTTSDLTEAVHEAHERNEKQRLLFANPRNGNETYDAAWRRQRAEGHTIHLSRT